VLLPLGGLAVKQGQMNLVALLVVAMVAQLAGVTVAYLIARSGGITLVERYGKYVLISTNELNVARRAFEKYGKRIVVVGAFVPGIQGFIGYVAGLAEMKYGHFLLSVFVGKVVWIGGLVYLGTILGTHLDLIDRSMKQIGVVVLASLVLAGIWYLKRHHKNKTAIARRPREEN
jgi:membrane protein DedA with SNARE-associated domain